MGSMKKETIRIYILYDFENWRGAPLRDRLEYECPGTKFEVKGYASIPMFEEGVRRGHLSKGDVIVVHLGQGSEKADPETLENFIRDIRSRWPFCRIGIESGAFQYSTGEKVQQATVEEVLKNNLPDFYFFSRFGSADDSFLRKQLLKGSLSCEEIAWREGGNVLTPVVEVGPGSRMIERE